MKRFFSTLTLFICLSANAQVYTQLAPALTNQYLGADLQVGFRHNNTFTSIGYTAIINATQPALFNVRAGVIMNERWLLYGGYVRNHMSNDYKERNFNTWQAGAQYHFLHYEKGTFYVITNYTHPARVTVGIGISFNLFK